MPQINATDTASALHKPAAPSALHLPQSDATDTSTAAGPAAGTTIAVPQVEVQMQPSPFGAVGLWVSLFAIVIGVILGFRYRGAIKRHDETERLNALNDRIKMERPR